MKTILALGFVCLIVALWGFLQLKNPTEHCGCIKHCDGCDRAAEEEP
ncbi:MAG: hypothetical protein KDC35_02655 [Acidobacteria bacterium]|nr:hypothetical protein [Acidobacteriota bacterium]